MPYIELNGKEYTGEWEASEIKIDGEKQPYAPLLIFQECDIFEDTCYGIWSFKGQNALFTWQFKDNGKSFLINREEDVLYNPDFVTDAELQCYNYSGLYDVNKSNKSKMVLESSTTYGYPNQFVKITIETESE